MLLNILLYLSIFKVCGIFVILKSLTTICDSEFSGEESIVWATSHRGSTRRIRPGARGSRGLWRHSVQPTGRQYCEPRERQLQPDEGQDPEEIQPRSVTGLCLWEGCTGFTYLFFYHSNHLPVLSYTYLLCERIYKFYPVVNMISKLPMKLCNKTPTLPKSLLTRVVLYL